MSKHQTCPNCHNDFIGPDSNINKNLCPECDSVIHKECYEKIRELENTIFGYKELVKEAIEIIEGWKKVAQNLEIIAKAKIR